MRGQLLVLLAWLGALHCARGSWFSGPRRALAPANTADPILAVAADFPTTDSTGTVSVTTPDALMAALLNRNTTTIRIAADVVVNSTRARAQLLQAGVRGGVVNITRDLTIVGISSVRPGTNRTSLALLDFGQLTAFLRLPDVDSTLEFRALHLRGMYQLLDDLLSVLTDDSRGTVRFTGVVSQRTACLPPAQQLQKIMDAARAAGSGSSSGSGGGGNGGPKNTAGLAGGSGSGDESFAAPPPTEDVAASDVAGFAAAVAAPPVAEDAALLYDGKYCVPLAEAGGDGGGGGGGGSLGFDQADQCFDQPLLLQDFSFTISAKRAPEESLVGPTGGSGSGSGSDAGIAAGNLLAPGLRVTFNMTILLCDVFVEAPCADATGGELAACIQKLLDRKYARPPPPSPSPLPAPLPSLPSPPSPPPPSPSPSPLLGAPTSSRSVPLTATLLPSLLALAAAAVGGIVAWRRCGRRDGTGGAGGGTVCFDKLQQQDSDQGLQVEIGGGGPGPGGGAKDAKAAAGDARSTAAGGGGGKSSYSYGAAGRYGKYGKGGSAAGTAAASSAGGLSSSTTGLTATTSAVTTTPGASPPDSGGTDPTRSITLHHQLGSGSFGRVYYGTWRGQGVAVKIIPHTAAASAKVQQEVALCVRFDHPNVVRSLHCVSFDTQPPEHQISQLESLRSGSTATASTQPAGLTMETWIVLEYCNAGSLASHLHLKAAALATAAPSGEGGGPSLSAHESSSLLLPPAAAAAAAAGAAAEGQALATPNASLGLSAAAQRQRDAALAHMRGLLSVARDIACGMAYLHSLNVCHGDLKCENVLLVFNGDADVADGAAAAAAPPSSADDDQQGRRCGSGSGGGVSPAAAGAGAGLGPSTTAAAPESAAAAVGRGGGGAAGLPFVAKVADFGLSKTFSDVSTHMSTATVGTVTHMCPVLLLTGQMRPSCDVFSFGIMLWQMSTGGTPFAGMRYAEIVYKVTVAGLRPEFPPHVPRRLVSVAEACWAGEPTARPTFEQLVRQLGELLEAAEELQAEQDAALAAARGGGAAAGPSAAAAAAAVSEEEQRVVNTWAAAAAAALLE